MNVELGRIMRGIDSRWVNPVAREKVESFRQEMAPMGVKVVQIGNLIEVANIYFPLLSIGNDNPVGEKPTAICDINGVLTCTLSNISENNRKSWHGLKDLAGKTDKIIFSSSGINLGDEKGFLWQIAKPVFGGSFPKWPFLTDQAITGLDLFAKRSNPECKTEFVIGIKDKLFNFRDRIAQLALSLLEKDKTLIVIGSSFTDRKIIKRVAVAAEKRGINLRNRLYYFDTGHLIL